MEETLSLINDVRSKYPDVVRLASIVSLAVRVEPELLRNARLTLLPEVDAGAEADLWFSPIVQSQSPLALAFVPEVTEYLRQELAKDQVLLDQAWRVLEEVHQNAPPTILLEEEITWLALSQKDNATDIIEQRLQSVVTTMVKESQRERGLARWAVGVLPRLPETAQETEAAWMLDMGASTRLGKRPTLTVDVPTNGVRGLHWILPRDLPLVSIGVRLFENGIEFGAPSMKGARTIELPKTQPLLIEVSWEEDAGQRVEQVSLQSDQRQIVEVGSGVVKLQTALGKVYILRLTETEPSSSEIKDTALDLWKELMSGAESSDPKKRRILAALLETIISGVEMRGGTLEEGLTSFASTVGTKISLAPMATALWQQPVNLPRKPLERYSMIITELTKDFSTVYSPDIKKSSVLSKFVEDVPDPEGFESPLGLLSQIYKEDPKLVEQAIERMISSEKRLGETD